MTLYRQLILILSLLFLLLFVSSLWNGLHNHQRYLQLQLTSHAQDTATSLGVSLRPHLGDADLPAMDTLVNAIFDRGYYQHLLLTDMAGNVLVERRNTLQAGDVPGWFIKLFPLQAPSADTLINSGWKQAGRLEITSHPGYAYLLLWNSATDTLLWTALIFAAGLLLCALFIRWILHPLRAIESQAQAICNRDFPTLNLAPRSRELKQVVAALNRMTTKLRQLFDDLVDQLEGLRRDATTDAITGLENRRAFVSRLEAQLCDDDAALDGALILIRIQALERFNQQHGYSAGDKLLQETASRLSQFTRSRPRSYLARLSGADFGLALPGADLADTQLACQQLKQILTALGSTAPGYGIGATLYQRNQCSSELLALADHQLCRAELRGSGEPCINTEGWSEASSPARGTQGWQLLIKQAICENSLYLLGQPACRISTPLADDAPCSEALPPLPVIYRELLMRLRCPQQGTDLPAGSIVPMAERLGLTAALDRQVIEAAIHYLAQDERATTCLGINLSTASLLDHEFSSWLQDRLHTVPGLANRLVFEISEHQAVRTPELVQAFITSVHNQGGSVALEHFGLSLMGFQLLQRLKADYLKIDGSLSRAITHQKENQHFIQTLCKLAHGLDMQVIAEQVEAREDLLCLRELGVDAAQGYAIAKPTALESQTFPTPAGVSRTHKIRQIPAATWPPGSAS